jgi:hypothetical protein
MMVDRVTVLKVAKLLALSTSDNEGESASAREQAYKLAQRDGVKLEHLLALDTQYLYRTALTLFAALLAQRTPGLSGSDRDALLEKYNQAIATKFSPGSGGRAGESSSRKEAEDEQTKRNREREDAARAYEERRRQEEARRARSEPPPRQEQQKTEPPPKEERRTAKPYSRQNVYTAKDGIEFPISFDPSRFPFSFSTGAFFSFLFGADSFIGCIYSFPKLAVKLLFTSCLVGGITAFALFFGLGFLHHTFPIEPLLILFRFLFADPWFGLALIIFITSYVFYERGWYPRGPRQGQTDAFSITRELSRLALAILWRVWGVVAWIGNQSFFLAYKWRRARIEKETGVPDSTKATAEGKTQNAEAPQGGPAWWQWVIGALLCFLLCYSGLRFLLFIIVWLWSASGLPPMINNHTLAADLSETVPFMIALGMTIAALVSVRRDLVKAKRSGAEDKATP